MPTNPLLERLKKSIQKKQWTDTSKAFAIATSILQRNWYMKDGKLTWKWVIKSKLPEWTVWIKKKLKARVQK